MCEFKLEILAITIWKCWIFQQKVAEALFKELKLAKDDAFDKDAVISHLEKDIKEANWKPVMKAAAEECIKDIMAQKDKIITELEKAPFNIKKDQCNVLYMSMVTCIHLEGFEVRLYGFVEAPEGTNTFSSTALPQRDMDRRKEVQRR